MSAIRLLQAERKEEIQHLHRQFMSGGILQRELWEEAEKFLIQREIYDVILAEEQDLREYKQTLLDSGNYTKKQVKEQSFVRKIISLKGRMVERTGEQHSDKSFSNTVIRMELQMAVISSKPMTIGIRWLPNFMMRMFLYRQSEII